VPPAALIVCGELEQCISTNPENKVTYSVLVSKVIGQSISNLIEPISWKAIVVMTICCIGFFLLETRRNY
jgi:hypothetical protein